ncbi:MAG: hypothetical protein WC057_05450 [Dehalococcoidales bacterium]|jgi:hypothetical protein
MSNLKNRYMKQTAVYWAPEDTYDDYGQPVYADPVEKSCRWEDVAESFVGAKGALETSKSVVFIDGVVVGGLLMLGELSSSVNLVSLRENEAVWEIRQVESIPNRNASVTYMWAYL